MFPKHIALCGNPRAGKSLVQEILRAFYHVQPVDDGLPLRLFASQHLGLTWEQVSTQAGKLEEVVILGRVWQVRELLGQLGNRLEEMFGKDVMSHMALLGTKDRVGRYSYGSVRREQGLLYKARGGIVVEIVNPSAGPSNYEFDRYDRSIVDYRIENDALFRGLSPGAARKDLERKVIAMMSEHLAKVELGHD